MVQQDTSAKDTRMRRLRLQNMHAKKIDETNLGYQLLCKMDWKQGEGFGKNKHGKVDYVRVQRAKVLESSTAFTSATGLYKSEIKFGGQGIGYTGKSSQNSSTMQNDASSVSTAIFSQLLSTLQKNCSSSSDASKSSKDGASKPSFIFFQQPKSSTSSNTKRSSTLFISQHKKTKLTNAKVGNRYTSEDLSGIFHHSSEPASTASQDNSSPDSKKDKKRKRKSSKSSSKKRRKTQMSVSELSIQDYFHKKATEQQKIMY